MKTNGDNCLGLNYNKMRENNQFLTMISDDHNHSDNINALVGMKESESSYTSSKTASEEIFSNFSNVSNTFSTNSIPCMIDLISLMSRNTQLKQTSYESQMSIDGAPFYHQNMSTLNAIQHLSNRIMNELS